MFGKCLCFICLLYLQKLYNVLLRHQTGLDLDQKSKGIMDPLLLSEKGDYVTQVCLIFSRKVSIIM